MTTLDPAGTALLQRLAASEKPGLFDDVPPATGADRHDRVTIVLDAARRVVKVTVADPTAVRRPDDLVTAVKEAFATADGNRALASLEKQGLADDYLARADDLMAGRARAVAPPRPDLSREAIAARRAARGAAPTTAPPPAPVTAENGYVTALRGADGRLMRLEVDGEWLSAARPEHLERALEQALHFGSES
ncbi:hypothetical protein [Nocardioides lijunqiniae]|uniref:hypothetical protein n=1 Tax=Nocardioides lijunqiniae TaxID=2760832 RepID=UPI001877B517|nr:hypothetical protein [Nocardioides lijunqiniae]